MTKSLKIPFYILLFGILTFTSALFGPGPKKQYTAVDVLGSKAGLQLYIQPEAGHRPIIEAINLAQKEILVEVYLLSDRETITALKQASDRGVQVKVMMEQHPFGGGGSNGSVFSQLSSAGISTAWTNPVFALTHEKAIIIDGVEVCILNQNLTSAAFTKNREYDICDDNPQDVNDARNIFNADWSRDSFTPTAPDLVVSPVNSRGKLEALINSAQKSIDLEIEVIEDSKLIGLLAEKTKTVSVRIIIPPKSAISSNRTVPGAQTKSMSSPYIHAKMLLVDGQRAYTGSVNFSTQSLDQNRELGILISQQDIIDRLSQTFESDWESAIN